MLFQDASLKHSLYKHRILFNFTKARKIQVFIIGAHLVKYATKKKKKKVTPKPSISH